MYPLLPTLVLATLTLTACADAQPPSTPPADLVVVADGRDATADAATDATTWQAHPAIQKAVRDARGHWQAQDPGYEEEVRVMAVADGAFTEAEGAQHAVLYLMALWPRCCPKMGIAVVEGDRLVRNVAFEGVAQHIGAVPDLDGDGRGELVLRGSYGMGGDVSESATLVGFGPDGFTVTGGTTIAADGCAAGREGLWASRLLATPAPAGSGDGPAFTVEPYARPSCSDGPWEPASEPEPLPLETAPVETYVDLPVE